jgi:hypothetical protein
MVATPDLDNTHNRTPQELAKEALEQARTAKNSTDGMRAITTAIVALAGEVHALDDRSREPLVIKLDLL